MKEIQNNEVVKGLLEHAEMVFRESLRKENNELDLILNQKNHVYSIYLELDEGEVDITFYIIGNRLYIESTENKAEFILSHLFKDDVKFHFVRVIESIVQFLKYKVPNIDEIEVRGKVLEPEDKSHFSEIVSYVMRNMEWKEDIRWQFEQYPNRMYLFFDCDDEKKEKLSLIKESFENIMANEIFSEQELFCKIDKNHDHHEESLLSLFVADGVYYKMLIYPNDNLVELCTNSMDGVENPHTEYAMENTEINEKFELMNFRFENAFEKLKNRNKLLILLRKGLYKMDIAAFCEKVFYGFDEYEIRGGKHDKEILEGYGKHFDCEGNELAHMIHLWRTQPNSFEIKREDDKYLFSIKDFVIIIETPYGGYDAEIMGFQ